MPISLRLALLLSLATAAVGCQSEPFCLNCGEGDLSPIRLDLSEPADLTPPIDLSGMDLAVVPDLSQCAVTNGGVEVCDSIDNDCNGTVDDVAATKLAMDPQNCGACGTKCNFVAQHQFGACQPDGNNVPTCVPTTCLPGYYDYDANTPGCEYQCVVTGAEICDGQDNDCDGDIDKGLDSLGAPVDYGYPTYALSASNCGSCGTSCGLPGANTACQMGGGGQGTCVVTSCQNTPNMQTFRHNPANGDINATGCEYRCPIAATSAGDCNTMSCMFAAESCNGIDDNCDFAIDNGTLADVNNVPCYDTCPGGLAANCGGGRECQPGTLTCLNGAPTCTGGVGPAAEICDGKDNNCDGNIDEPFGYPLYNTDPNNCGGCYKPADNNTQAFSCNDGTPYANWHAVRGCHTDASVQPQGSNKGVCYVVACDENAVGGYRHRGVACGGSTNVVDGPSGTGCDYACPSWPRKGELCNGTDDDCDGCVDETLTAPAICSSLGACNTNSACSGPCVAGFCPTIGGGSLPCGGSRFTPSCTGAGGWVCDYRGDSLVEADASTGGLAGSETKCDQRDNNCNNVVDTDGFALISYTSPLSCTDTGLGQCQRTGTYQCNGGGTNETCLLTSPVVPPSTEICDGKDNDCDGATDETKGTPGSNPSYVVEDMKLITRPDTTTFYMYTYEASRPDALGGALGVSTARACSKQLVRPWATVTQPAAAAACTAAGMRLCTEDEWTLGCSGSGMRTYPYGNAYDAQACNGKDYRGAGCGTPDTFEGPLPTGSTYGCPATTTCASQDLVVDLSGNVKEWTSTIVTPATMSTAATYAVKGGAYNNIDAGLTCGFDFTAFEPTVALDSVGFRCCSDTAP